MDGITFSERSSQGCKYCVVLRDQATGAFHFIPLFRKADIVTAFGDWVSAMRKDPLYADMPYPVVSKVVTDNESTWGRKASQWIKMIAELNQSVQMHYVCPDRHAEENGYAESACKIVEHQIKALLFSNSLPGSAWQDCASDALFLLNRFPVQSDDIANPSDGDRARPLEMLTRGHYSRRMIDNELSYFIPCGTPAMVNDPDIKGSSLRPKTRWGIACGMYRDQPTWRCPFTKSMWRSKSYSAYRLRPGVNYGQFLNVPIADSAVSRMRIPEEALDGDEMVDIGQGPGIVINDETAKVRAEQTATTDTEPQLGGTDHVSKPNSDNQEPDSVQTDDGNVHDEGNEDIQDDTLIQLQDTGTEEPADMTQWKQLTDDKSDQIRTGTRKRNKPATLGSGAPSDKEVRSKLKGPASKRNGKKKTKSHTVDRGSDDVDMDDPFAILQMLPEGTEQKLADKEVEHNFNNAVRSGVNMTFKAMMNKHLKQVPHKLWETYRQWLIQIYEYNPTDITNEKRVHVKANIKFPAPAGKEWRRLVNSTANRAMRSQEEHDEVMIANEALQQTFVEQAYFLKAFNAEMKQDKFKGFKRIIKRKKAVKAADAGQEQPPTTFRQAFNGPHSEEWKQSADSEFNGLTNKGVLEHDFTLSDLQEAGVIPDPISNKVKPMGMSVVLSHKYTDGVLMRYKTRLALAGHAGNMKPGEHYDKTFAASPNANTSRLLQALCVYKKWFRYSFDIEQAYLHAELPPGKLIAVKYPDGFKRYNEDGEELFMLLKKNIYGHPAASRAWSKTRDAYLMKRFNSKDKDGTVWTCKRTRMDPCLFKFTCTRPNGEKEEAISLVYTDDCDMIGSTKEITKDIFEIIKQKWGAKEVDADFVLGVKRVMTRHDNGEMEIEMSMEAFINGMVEAFKDHLPEANVKTPFPDGLKLSRQPIVAAQKNDDSDEIDEEIIKVLDKGYMRAVGMILWAARNVYAECTAGVSQLCRVMSCPTEEAWAAAMHMIKWMDSRKTNGIKFTSEGLHPLINNHVVDRKVGDNDEHIGENPPIINLSETPSSAKMASYNTQSSAERATHNQTRSPIGHLQVLPSSANSATHDQTGLADKAPHVLPSSADRATPNQTSTAERATNVLKSSAEKATLTQTREPKEHLHVLPSSADKAPPNQTGLADKAPHVLLSSAKRATPNNADKAYSDRGSMAANVAEQNVILTSPEPKFMMPPEGIDMEAQPYLGAATKPCNFEELPKATRTGVPRTGFGTPVVFSDASNDIDLHDGLAQAGYTVMMCSGPVIFNSRKLKHKAPNGAASHVEYMALCNANQAVVWLRQLLYELDLHELLDHATLVYGDNKQANTLCKEDVVTAGNMYIYLSYHWNKEVEENGFADVRNVRTALNIADLFTKPVPGHKIKDLMNKLIGYEFIDFDEIDEGFNSKKKKQEAPKLRDMPFYKSTGQ